MMDLAEHRTIEVDLDKKNLGNEVLIEGKILPSRITNVSRIKQKELSNAIKRSRFLGLMSYTNKIF